MTAEVTGAIAAISVAILLLSWALFADPDRNRRLAVSNLTRDLGPQAPAEEPAGTAAPDADTPEGWAPYPNVREDATVAAPAAAAPASPTDVTTVQPAVSTATDKEVTA